MGDSPFDQLVAACQQAAFVVVIWKCDNKPRVALTVGYTEENDQEEGEFVLGCRGVSDLVFGPGDHISREGSYWQVGGYEALICPLVEFHRHKLSKTEQLLLIEALDSHAYWQLSSRHNRNDGYVIDPDREEPDVAEKIHACQALESKLRERIR